jgi:tricarballylate dehydrogenase
MATADTLVELASKLEIRKDAFIKTIRNFNSAVRDASMFSQGKLDGAHTIGINPPKSHWAVPIIKPPFWGYPVTSGLTFTYGGLKIDENARVIHCNGDFIPGLYAAGEMVGGLFNRNYPGGSGMMAGAVFGRIAGKNAALCKL